MRVRNPATFEALLTSGLKAGAGRDPRPDRLTLTSHKETPALPLQG